MNRFIISCLLFILSTSSLMAQARYISRHEPEEGTKQVGTLMNDVPLWLDIDALAFFCNDEFNIDMIPDYTLPGYRTKMALMTCLIPKHDLRLSIGVDHLHYWGASYYPSGMGYRDLPYWSSEGPYKRFRIHPYFRASVQPFSSLEITLGSLRFGADHDLIEPLYNSELRYTADREAGIEVRWRRPRLSLDAWVNWQSFIFSHDRHPEAFIWGIKSDYDLYKGKDYKVTIPFQLLASHRGGKLNDIIPDTVHTWMNPALGVRTTWYRGHDQKTEWQAGLYLLGYSQRGEHYKIDKGWAAYTEIGWYRPRGHIVAVGYYGDHYLSPWGTPFAQTVNFKGERYRSDGRWIYTGLIGEGLIWSWRGYRLGGKLGAIYTPWLSSPRVAYKAEIYLRITPSILLGRMRSVSGLSMD